MGSSHKPKDKPYAGVKPQDINSLESFNKLLIVSTMWTNKSQIYIEVALRNLSYEVGRKLLKTVK